MKGRLVVENKDKLLEGRALANTIKAEGCNCMETASFCTSCYGMPCNTPPCNLYMPEYPKNEKAK